MKIGQNKIEKSILSYNFLKYYSELFKLSFKERKYPWFVAYCPFHNDKKTPNLNVNVITGRYKCFACDKKGEYTDFSVSITNDGADIHFTIPEYLNDKKELERQWQHKIDKQKKVDNLTLRLEEHRAAMAHKLLYKQPHALKYLHEKRGLTDKTIKEFGIGYLQGNVTLPVYDKEGKLISLKHHKATQTEGASTQIYPWKAVLEKHNYVVLVEGEFDVMITYQNGFNSATLTNGAMSWESKFCDYFKNKTVYLAYDNDIAGKSATKKIASDLVKYGIKTRIIVWPKFMKDKEDNVDFFVKYNMNATNYNYLLSSAIPIEFFIKKKG